MTDANRNQTDHVASRFLGGFSFGRFSVLESLISGMGLVCLVVWVADPFCPVADPACCAGCEFSLVVEPSGSAAHGASGEPLFAVLVGGSSDLAIHGFSNLESLISSMGRIRGGGFVSIFPFLFRERKGSE